MQELKERVINEGYNKKPMDQQFSKVKTIDRNELKKRKKHDKETRNKTPLELIYNLFLSNISNIVRKYWDILGKY